MPGGVALAASWFTAPIYVCRRHVFVGGKHGSEQHSTNYIILSENI